MTLNCRSLRSKTAQLKVLLQDHKIDIGILQETWLTQGEKSVYAEFKEMGYRICKLERKKKKGGGLAILIKPKAQKKISTFYNFNYQTFENIICSFNVGKCKITVVNIYRPPSTSKSEFLIQLDDFISKVIEIEGLLFIFGDFNIDLLLQNGITDRFHETLNKHGLLQLVEVPTRETALLDLMIVPNSSSNSLNIPSPYTDFQSDHKPCFLSFKMNNPLLQLKPLKKEIRNFHSLDVDKLRQLIERSTLSEIGLMQNLDAEKCVNIYNTEILKLADVLCPPQIRTFKRDKSTRWFNPTLQNLKRKRRQAERLLRKSPSNETYLDGYKKARNQFTSGLKQARNEFFSSKIQRLQNDPKGLYKVLNELTGGKSEIILPSQESDSLTAEMMAKFYINKVQKIRDVISTTALDPPTSCYTTSDFSSIPKSIEPLTCFSLLNITELKEITTKLKKKFCCLDPLPTTVLMKCIDLLHPLILKIVNFSLFHGVFPQSLKHAVVSPILKNHKLDSDQFQNYRPVSSLPFLEKIVEQAIFKQLNQHLEHNKLYAKYQSAYRTGHSCETTLTNLVDDIQLFNSQDDNVVLVLLDQSAAFDTVDHAILLKKLQNTFYIRNKALSLFISYLKNRTFSVKINDKLSSPSDLKYGVPQGSLLGPILYILYTADIEEVVMRNGFQILTYADDCQLYSTFNNNNITDMENSLRKCLTQVKKWMGTNYLMLNPDKTLIKVFWHKLPNPTMGKVLNYDLMDTIKVLGVDIGDNVKLKSFISKKVQACNMHLRNLYNIRESLDTKTRTLLVTNFILSKIDYCNILLLGCTDKDLRPLRLVINKSLRFIFNVRFRDHITPYYEKAHFLPIRKRIKFKACLLAYKLFYRISPIYLENKIDRYETNLQMQLREGAGSRDGYMFDTKGPEDLKCKTLLSKIKVEWNALPLTLRKNESLPAFKAKLKTKLFKDK